MIIKGGSAEPPLFLLDCVAIDPRLHGERIIIKLVYNYDFLSWGKSSGSALKASIKVVSCDELGDLAGVKCGYFNILFHTKLTFYPDPGVLCFSVS